MAGLMMLWQPILQGVLQGRQNFLWLGWVSMFNGVGRVGISGIFVWLLHQLGQRAVYPNKPGELLTESPNGWWAAGIMAGTLLGLVALVATAAYQIRDLWKAERLPFDSRDWLKRVIPLTFGAGAGLFLLSADVIVVKSSFSNWAPYLFGITMAKAIVQFTAPLAAVMFPKVVRNATQNQQSSLLGLTLLGTLVLSGMAAIALPIVAPFAIKFGSRPEYKTILPLIPLFAWAMVPLSMGNVLLNNLMARSRFGVVPWLVLISAGYWFSLLRFHDSFGQVVQVFGIFNTLMLITCVAFTWGGKPCRE